MAERSVFRPYGEAIATDFAPAVASESKGYIGERYDGDAGLQYLNARYYDPKLGMFIQPDWWEVMKPGVGNNRYSYSFGDPVNKSDGTGHEVVKNSTGKVSDLKDYLDSSPSKVGQKKGKEAQQALRNFGKTNWDLTPKDNYLSGAKAPRYVYTKAAGWMDMYHFMHYAGRANTYLDSYKRFGPEKAKTQAIESAINDGYAQEKIYDRYTRKGLSSYSYEDLPSDLYGATFGARVFDPKSNRTLGEQVSNYLESLGATAPSEAGNYESLPESDVISANRYTNWRNGATVGPDPIPRNYDTTPFLFPRGRQ